MTSTANIPATPSPANSQFDDDIPVIMDQAHLLDLKNSQPKPRPWIPFRYFVILLFFIGPAMSFAVRCVLNVAILAMVGGRNAPLDPNLVDDDIESNVTSTKYQTHYPFDWNQKEQGVILGAYFYTYAAAQIISGVLSDRFNTVHLTIITQLISSACSFLSPIAAQIDIYCLIAVRMLLGFAHGIMLPSCYNLMERWLPPGEVALAQSLLCVGCNFGMVIAMPLTAWLCENGFAGGWPSSFYVMGAANLVYIFIWWLLMTPDPSSNPFVSNYEKSYLEMVINKKPKLKVKTPWLKMLASMSLWSVVIARGLQGLGYYTINAKIPVYLEAVIGYKLQGNGLINGLLYLVLCSTQLISGPLSKWIILKGWVNVTATRKIFETIALVGMGLCLLSIPHLGHQPSLIVACLVVSMFFLGATVGGDIPIVSEMAPHLVGTAFGFANTLGCSAGFVAPLIVGFIISGQRHSQSKWNLAFNVIGCLQFIGAGLFALFATAKPQRWGKVDDDGEQMIPSLGNKV